MTTYVHNERLSDKYFLNIMKDVASKVSEIKIAKEGNFCFATMEVHNHSFEDMGFYGTIILQKEQDFVLYRSDSFGTREFAESDLEDFFEMLNDELEAI